MRKIDRDNMPDSPKTNQSERCVILCSGSTRIEALNTAAKNAEIFPSGTLLSEHMNPIDALKFEAAAKSLFALPPLVFPLLSVNGFSYDASHFKNIMGMKIAVTLLYKSFEECIADTENSRSENHASKHLFGGLTLLSGTDGAQDGIFSDRPGLIPLYGFTENALFRLAENNSFFDCRLKFNCRAKPDVNFNCAGLEGFVASLSLMLYSANELSYDKNIEVSISAGGNSPLISVSTQMNGSLSPAGDSDALPDAFPPISSPLKLCEYCAGCCGFELSAKCSADSLLTLTLKANQSLTPETDFKCPDGLLRIGEFCNNAVNMLKRLRSSDQQ